MFSLGSNCSINPNLNPIFFNIAKKFQKNRTFLIPRVSMGVKLQLISPTKKEAP